MSFFKAIIFIISLAGCSLIHAQNWDVNITKSINPQHPNSNVWKGLSASSYPISFAAPLGLIMYSKISNNKQTFHNGVTALVSVGGAVAATEALKIIINRQRPYQKYPGIYPYETEDGKSFPSAHTSLAFATATSLSLSCKKWYVIAPAYAWATGIGYSRLYLGEHYFTDVAAGAAVGTASAFISRWLTKKLFNY